MSIVLDGTSGITTPEIVSTGGPLVVNASAPDNSVVVNASGDVGIGTSSPNTKLHITGNLTIENSSNAPFINFVESGDNTDVKARIEMDQISGTAGNLLFYTEGGGTLAERARITSAGDLLVGLTAKVDSGKQCIRFNGPTQVGIAIQDIDNQSGARFVSFVGAGGGSIGAIDRVSTTNAVQYLTTSDYRLKHDIAPMTGALAKVALLKPVTYKWNADDSESQGFIAHELQEVVPDCVSREKDAVDAEGNPQYQGIDTSFLVATLTAAIQELKAINDAQAQTIESLTARVVALEQA